jgi:hypothetical protein
MNLRTMLGLGSLLLIATGCPSEWGKGGINDRAMAKDTRKALEDDEAPCPEGMTLQEDCTKRRPDGSCREICQ